jgi:hypothetical protein
VGTTQRQLALTPLLWRIAAACAAIGFAGFFAYAYVHGGYDVRWYYFYARLLLQQVNIWEVFNSQSVMEACMRLAHELGLSSQMVFRFAHSPGFAFLFAPFANLSFLLASRVWMAILFLASAATTTLLCREYGGSGWKKPALAVLLLIFWPLYENIYLGQVNILVLFLLVVGLIFIKRGHSIAAGVCLGIAFPLKELAIPVLGACIFNGKWRTLVTSLAVYAVITAGSIGVFGIPVFKSYLNAYTTYFGRISSEYSISVYAVATRVFSNNATGIPIGILYAAAFALLAWVCVCAKRYSSNTGFEYTYALFVLWSVCAVPWVTDTHLLFAIIAIAILWPRLDTLSVRALAGFGACCVLVGARYTIRVFHACDGGILALLHFTKIAGCLGLMGILARVQSQEKQVHV